MTYTFSIPSFEGFTELTQKIAEEVEAFATNIQSKSQNLQENC